MSAKPALVWIAFLGYCSVVFVGSCISRVPDELSRIPDYVLHAGEFFVMGVLAHLAFRARPLSWRVSIAALAAFVFCVVFGLTDELHQFFVEGRSSTIKDVGADAVGAGAAQVAVMLHAKLRGTLSGAAER